MKLSRWIASGLGSGLCPVAPGTAGSLAALMLGAGLLTISPAALPVAIVTVCVLGVWSIRAAGAGAADPGWIVIDEFAGQWIAMLPLAWLQQPPTGFVGLVVAFLLFRLFDITKPGPVGWADRRHDAIGVMGDDVIAGAMAAAILSALLWFVPDLIEFRF
jgi:phosphatidylglycerophosphatase A